MKHAASISSLTFVVLSAGVLASSAFGADTVFKNHLRSKAIVSPAQLYQVNQTKSDFQLGFNNGSTETKTDAGKEKNEVSGTDVFAAAIYSAEPMNLRAGVSLDYETAKSNITNSMAARSVTDGADTTALTVTPQAAILLGPVSIGAAVDVVQTRAELDAPGSDTVKTNYTRPKVGVALVQPMSEIGAVYTAKVDKTDKFSITNDQTSYPYPTQLPSEVTLHGRMALDSTMALGATVSQVYQSQLDQVNTGNEGQKTKLTDQNRVRAIWEMLAGATKVEADVGRNTAYYNGKDNANIENIATWEVGAAADYAVSEAANVGASVDYAWGNDTGSNSKKLNVSATSFAVRGNVRF